MTLFCVKLDRWSEGHLKLNQSYEARPMEGPHVQINMGGTWWWFSKDNFMTLDEWREEKINIIIDG